MEKKKVIAIRTGQSAGEAFGYSDRVVTIRPEKTSYEITANIEDPELPAKKGEVKTDADTWRTLIESDELDKLEAIPEARHSKDATDAGEEWIEFEMEDGTRRVEYSALEPIAELNETIETLRRVRLTVEDGEAPPDDG